MGVCKTVCAVREASVSQALSAAMPCFERPDPDAFQKSAIVRYIETRKTEPT